MSTAPDNWIDAWRHNNRWMYDTPEAAWSVVSDNGRRDFDLYGYRQFAVEFQNGIPSPIKLPDLNVVPFDRTFEELGFDVVSSSTGDGFECSPLSCNGMASEVQTNQYCLLATLESALEFARTCEGEGCEPGPYYVIAVFRQKKLES